MIFNIDFEKAYDHIYWDLLDLCFSHETLSTKVEIPNPRGLSSISFVDLVKECMKGWVRASRDQK